MVDETMDMDKFYLVRITSGVILIFILVILISGIATYPMQHVSWKSREVFTHYENVTVPRNVSVSISVVTLSGGSNGGNATVLSKALQRDLARILRSEGLSPQFIGEEASFVAPKDVNISESKINGPVVFVYVPYYGHETHLLYSECYASVLIYMNSNPDVGSYISMVNRYSNGGHLPSLAKWLFEKAKTDEKGSYSLGVVYWDTLRVRTSSKSNENCWDMLAGKIANETKGWVKTLRPSNGS